MVVWVIIPQNRSKDKHFFRKMQHFRGKPHKDREISLNKSHFYLDGS